ncbi:MAG: DUF167 domain-containing protein [Patescibacteria group bacterium]
MIFRLRAKVRTKARANSITKDPTGKWVIRVTAAPSSGQANDKVVELLAEEFNTAKSNITIVQGLRSNEKVIEIFV